MTFFWLFVAAFTLVWGTQCAAHGMVIVENGRDRALFEIFGVLLVFLSLVIVHAIM